MKQTKSVDAIKKKVYETRAHLVGRRGGGRETEHTEESPVQETHCL